MDAIAADLGKELESAGSTVGFGFCDQFEGLFYCRVHYAEAVPRVSLHSDGGLAYTVHQEEVRGEADSRCKTNSRQGESDDLTK